MPGVSNTVFLPTRPRAPLPGSGWTVRVIAHTDLGAYAAGTNPAALTLISRYTALSWSPEISDVGAGSITISLSDPIWAHPLAGGRPAYHLRAYENLFVVYEDGQWRGEFLGRLVTETFIDGGENAGRQVVISGPGTGQHLQHAKVFTPYYPRTTPKGKIGIYQFRDKPVMGCWLALLQAAQKRGTIGYVRAAFTAARDTAGVAWEDTPAVVRDTNAEATLAGDVLFAFGSSALTTAGKAAVKAIADKIAKVTYPAVTVVGHTDNVGSNADNQQLSLDRANTVSNHLQSLRPGVQVTVVGKGETQPRATNATAAGRSRNRRVRVTYQAFAAAPTTVFEPDLGIDLLSLLRNLTSGSTATDRGPVHAEWIMRKGFRLEVRSQLGTDRSATCVFHPGSDYVQSEGRTFDRDPIANLIAVQTELGVYKTAASAASRGHWLQREQFTRLSGSFDAKVQAQVAATQLAAFKDEADTATIAITPGPGRRPWRDFQLGDTIGLVRPNGVLPSRLTRQRVVAMTVTIDSTGAASYELTLQTTRARRLKYLQAQIDSLTNRRKGIRAFITDDEPTGGVAGDLWTPLTELDPDTAP